MRKCVFVCKSISSVPNPTTKIIQCNSEENWNNFVKENCTLTPLSLNPSLGNIFQKTFNWESKYLLIESESGTFTFFPFVLLKNKLVSLPHFSYGCVICENKHESYNNKFLQQLKFELDNYSINKYEIRSFFKLSENVYTDKVISFINLNDYNTVFFGFKSNLRRKIRKSVKNGLIIKHGKTELLNDFYKVLCENFHRLGSPVLPIAFFRNLLTDYKYGNSLIWVIYFNEKPIGSSFMLSYYGYFENIWLASLKKYNHLYTSYLLNWSMIKYACDNNGDIFSFGRSSLNSGVHNYKKQWGAYDKQLYWNHSSQKKFNIRKQSWMKELWKRIPLPIASLIGPYFAKRIY